MGRIGTPDASSGHPGVGLTPQSITRNPRFTEEHFKSPLTPGISAAFPSLESTPQTARLTVLINAKVPQPRAGEQELGAESDEPQGGSPSSVAHPHRVATHVREDPFGPPRSRCNGRLSPPHPVSHRATGAVLVRGNNYRGLGSNTPAWPSYPPKPAQPPGRAREDVHPSAAAAEEGPAGPDHGRQPWGGAGALMCVGQTRQGKRGPRQTLAIRRRGLPWSLVRWRGGAPFEATRDCQPGRGMQPASLGRTGFTLVELTPIESPQQKKGPPSSPMPLPRSSSCITTPGSWSPGRDTRA